MTKKFTLEITVESVEAARAAERGGADRIELCADLHTGGLTPLPETMHATRAAVRLPIFAMIRPRRVNFFYTKEELGLMKSQIALARDLRMDGIVLGLLHQDKTVDVQHLRDFVNFAAPLPVTFHRAFDKTPDLFRALEDVISAGAARILTSGGATRAPDALQPLGKLVAAAAQRIIIVPGSGIRADNFSLVRETTNACEFHAGLSSVLPYGSTDFARLEAAVRAIVERKSQCS